MHSVSCQTSEQIFHGRLCLPTSYPSPLFCYLLLLYLLVSSAVASAFRRMWPRTHRRCAIHLHIAVITVFPLA